MTTPAPGSDTLADLIIAHAQGLHAQAAAADLLIGHRFWLSSPAFATGFIELITDQEGQATGARIDYTAAIGALSVGRLPCTGSQAAILTIAASIGAGLPIALSRVLGNLDHRNIALVTDAIHAANGT